MKRKILLISLISISVLLFGCDDSKGSEKLGNSGKPNVGKEIEKEIEKDISAYYPIKENVRYVYEGTGNEYASYDVYVDYAEDNKVQRRVDNGGTVVAEVIEVRKDEVAKLVSKSETYYRENLLKKDSSDMKDKNAKEILLKSPLENGNSWDLDDGRKRTITDVDFKVEIMGKEYKSIEVTTEGSNDSKTKDYYVKDLGLVKSVFLSEGMEVTSVLIEVKEDAVSTQSIKFFYPDIDDGKLHHKEKNIDFKTNDITKEILNKSYKESLSEEDGVVLTENTKINYLYLNEDGMVYIDLNKEFLKEMNAGSIYESMILDSIATTFGNYYGADKVILTIDGNNYESGHIVLEKGEYLEVNSEATM